jgi:cytochrome c
MLKPLLLLSAVVVLCGITPATTSAIAAGGAGPQAPPSPSVAPKSTPASQERAKKLYAVDCSMCHADNGNGKTDLAKDMSLTLTDWTDPKSLADKTDQQLFDVIRNGKDKMPPESDGRAKNDDVWGLVAYIRGFSKGQAAAPAN